MRNAQHHKWKYLLFALFAVLLLASPAQGAKVPEPEETEAAKEVSSGQVIGIDLGTTYSCVGIYRNGGVEIIANDQGNRITPSYVAFADGQRQVGDAAKWAATTNPRNTIFDAKRIIGRQFNDKSVQSDMKHWPFDVVNVKGKPQFKVEFQGEAKKFTPEEISAFVLQEMKRTAEDFLGEKVTQAVITVPAYFDESQRQATIDAGTIAGLEVLRIINEPTAAALAYGLDKQTDELNVLVYDLGGGTFDVSVLTLDDGVFEVLATNGDTHLGGKDFDQNVMTYFTKTWKKKTGIDITKNIRALAKLTAEVEIAKRGLSSQHQVKIEIENFAEGQDFSETLTRARFEALNNAAFKKTLNPIRKVMKDAGLKKRDIQEIVFVGGSTRIPKIRELVTNFFDGKQPNRGINPDEAVASGAAVLAGILSGDADEKLDKMMVIDVTPLSLGIKTVGDVVTKIVEKNTIIPTTKTQIFSTHQDNQPAVTIEVYQGERVMAKDCIHLGKFDLTGIPKMPRGQPQIEVTFEIDANSILTVKASEKSTGKAEELVLTAAQHHLDPDVVEDLARQAKQYEAEDARIRETVQSKNQLESQVLSVKSDLEDDESETSVRLAEDEKETILEACDEILDFLTNNPDADLEDIKEKSEEFQELVQPILGEAYDGSDPHPGTDEDLDDWDEHDEL